MNFVSLIYYSEWEFLRRKFSALFLPRKAGSNGPVLPSLTYKLDGIFDKIVPSQPSSSFVVASSNTSTLELHGTLGCHFIRRTSHSVHHPGAQERWEKATRTGSRTRNLSILSLVPPTSSARVASLLTAAVNQKAAQTMDLYLQVHGSDSADIDANEETKSESRPAGRKNAKTQKQPAGTRGWKRPSVQPLIERCSALIHSRGSQGLFAGVCFQWFCTKSSKVVHLTAPNNPICGPLMDFFPPDN